MAFKFSCSCVQGPRIVKLWKRSDLLAAKAHYEYKVFPSRSGKLTRNADIERANEAHWVSESAVEINSVLKRKRKEATNTETAKSVADVKGKWGNSMWKVKVKLIEREKRSSLLGFCSFTVSIFLSREAVSSVPSAHSKAQKEFPSFDRKQANKKLQRITLKIFNYARLHNERLQHNFHSRLFTMVSGSKLEALTWGCLEVTWNDENGFWKLFIMALKLLTRFVWKCVEKCEKLEMF